MVMAERAAMAARLMAPQTPWSLGIIGIMVRATTGASTIEIEVGSGSHAHHGHGYTRHRHHHN